jgi:glycosyltransferase involved in cell wall biosynthesis
MNLSLNTPDSRGGWRPRNRAVAPKRIVGIISFMNAAGAQEAMLRLMRQLRLRGHETEVWFLYEQNSCYRGEPGVRVLREKAHLSPLEYVSLYFQLLSLIKEARPDAVIGFLPLGNVMGLSAAAFAGVKNRIASQRSPGSTFSRTMRLMDRWLGTGGGYSAVVCVSAAVQKSFAHYPPAYRSKLSVVNNGIEWTESPLDKVAARATLEIPADYPLFVATGRFTEQKNYGLMIRAAAATPRIRLAIAGEGPLRGSMRTLARSLGAEDRIHFLGNLSKPRVYDLLRAADVFVQSSLFEGQSNSTLEAMHAGLPIVCSDIEMQRETVCDGDAEPAAILVSLDDLRGWVAAFTRLRDDSAFADELGQRAKSLVERRFTLQRMIDGFERVVLNTENEQWKAAEASCVAEGADSIL